MIREMRCASERKRMSEKRDVGERLGWSESNATCERESKREM